MPQSCPSKVLMENNGQKFLVMNQNKRLSSKVFLGEQYVLGQLLFLFGIENCSKLGGGGGGGRVTQKNPTPTLEKVRLG